jgi:UDPglucose--hexose-1-phosphate uridylyltransferase
MQPLEPPPATTPRYPRIHLDPVSGRAVFVAPDRADRPLDQPGSTASVAVETCPFCAGNEHLTPPDVVRATDAAGSWQARIVPNRYPLAHDLPQASRSTPAKPGGDRAAHGIHEVVIESPRHERSILAIDPGSWEIVWRLCRERLAMLSTRPDLAWATIFKNSGPRAGASLEHVHSQLVAIDFVPATIRDELASVEAAPNTFETLVREAEAEGRVVESSGNLVALCPPAPRQPFETWIVPRHDAESFTSASDDDIAAVAFLTRALIGRLGRVVPGTDYNWWLHQAPFAHAAGSAATTGGYRWHVEIMPRLAQLAGFELGTGCHITTLAAAESASMLSKRD